MWFRRQPLLGVCATALIVVISLGFIALFDWPTFRDWVSFFLMCTIPFTFVVGVFWRGEHPRSIAALRQPLRGLAFLGMALAVGAVVSTVLLLTVGGGITPPTPMAAQCVIISVPISFWLAVVWGGQPFTLIKRPLVAGFALLVTTYLIAVLVFRTLFNYDFLKGTPVYSASVDPQGPFDAWTVLVFIVTCMAAAFLLMQFDLWPLSLAPRLMKQPILGLCWTLVILVLGAAATYVGIHLVGMPAPQFLTTVTVPFLFGSIVVIIQLEGSLFTTWPQPVRGLASATLAAVVGVCLAWAYVAVSGIVNGDVPTGPPGFQGEVWLASALLAVTFPFLAYHADFFGMWPLRRTEPVAHDRATQPSSANA